MGKKEEQTVKKCVLPYHVLIVVVLVLCVFVGIVSAGNVNDETKNPLSSTMAKSQPEEPSSILTITILNETTASGEWFINAPGEFSAYIPYETKRLEENINSLEKGVEDLLLQEVKNTKIIEGNDTIILTFDLLGNYTNSFVTGEFRYTYELNEYAPCFLNVVKIVIPQNKTLISVNPGVNAREGNALIYYDYNWIYPLDIRFIEKTYTISVIMGEEWELPKPYLADSSELSEEKGLIRSELNEKHKSRFAEPDLLVGTGGDILDHIPQLNALQIAEAYKPRLYLDPSSDQCPDRVYYRVIKGKDSYVGFDAYLIQYFAYWHYQSSPEHEYDYEPIFIYVRNIGKKPYRVAYDHCDITHSHKIHRTYSCFDPDDGFYWVSYPTNDKAYYPYGNTPYSTFVYLLDISTSLTNNWDGNHVKLVIEHKWHTFDTNIAGEECLDYSLSSLTDAELIRAYRLELKLVEKEAFKYDISDPFDGVFWEDQYHRFPKPKFPTISGNVKSAVVNNEILTVEVSMFYNNTGAGGSPGEKHLRGLWADRFNTTILTDTGHENIGIPKELDEQSPGEYILKFDVGGMDIIDSDPYLTVSDNLNESKWHNVVLNIASPTQSSPASAGDYENPSQKVDVKVNVSKGKDRDPVTGLNNADFTFKIGGKTATASLTDTSIPGGYVFSVTPPKQDAAGKYDFEVLVQYSGSTLEDKEEEAVIYTAGGHADVMLIIDRSGSMRGSAIADARNSAKLFVDYMCDDDYAGVVSFASSASYNYHLTPLTAAIKIAIKNAIDSITAGGNTAMGDGLRYGLNDLTSFGDTTHSWAMVLLSDGHQNQGEDPNTVLPDIKALDIRVFTIGLGPNVDKALLEHIATETDGEYCYAATSDQLREIYDYIVGKVVGWQTILERKTIIFLNQIIQIFVPIENPATEAIFSISWGGSDLDLVLYKPDGTKIDPAVAATDPKIEYVKEATYTFYRVTDPDPGEWIMEVTGVDIPPEGEEFTATVKAISSLFMSLTTDKDQYKQGEVIKTIASITEGGLPITGAAVNADITLPYGSTESLTLYDNGGHGDIAANDGVYANYFTNTEQIGNYKIDASATGTTPSGTSFSRQAGTTVEVVSGQSLINITQDTWSETVSPGAQVKTTFTVNDPATIGELFMINEYLHAEYNGTHYIVYNESCIGGEPDYIIPTSPSGKALAASPVSKWVSLTATSLQTPTGDIIDVSNIVLSSDVLEVPLGGSNDFNATINVPHDAPGGIYSGKIVATAIGGSDSVEVEITVISNPPIANANGPYAGVIEYIAVPITFDGTGSYATDPAGTITSYNWDLDNDGEFDDAFGATPTVSFTAPYSSNIHLKVTDNNGATDTDTTTLTITKRSPPPNGIHGGLLTPPEQPQCYSGTSTIQGKGYFTIDERIQDWATAIDSTEHIEGTGKFEMASKTVLDQAANTSDFYDPNFYYKKTMQFQGNATNRLISREKFESSGIFGGTGTRINEYFDVSMIQKDESGSIKTISAPGSGQSHRFATMDDFSGIWGIDSDWQKICQKKIAHHQMFIGNFSVQKDLTFEREVVMP